MSGPEKIRQGAAGVEGVSGCVLGHEQPVDAPDIFPPAKNLSNKALGRRQGAALCPIFGFNPLTHFQRLQQATIEVHGYQAVEYPWRLLGKCVLVRAKVAQGVLTKPVKLDLCIGMGDGKAKPGKITRVVGKPLTDLLNNLLGDLIQRHIGPVRYGDQVAPAGTVFRVVIPLATAGLSPIQQHPVTLAHVAVEILHAQLFAARGLAAEILTGSQESGVVVHSDRHPKGH